MPPATPPPASAERFRDTINVPIAIPAWGAVVMIAGALFTSGTLYQQMGTLIENSKRNDIQVSIIREKQIGDQAAINALEKKDASTDQRMTSVELRMTNVERAVFERKR